METQRKDVKNLLNSRRLLMMMIYMIYYMTLYLDGQSQWPVTPAGLW